MAMQTGTSLSGQPTVIANEFTTRFGHVTSSRLTATRTLRAQSFFCTPGAKVCTEFFVFFFSNVVRPKIACEPIRFAFFFAQKYFLSRPVRRPSPVLTGTVIVTGVARKLN